MPLHSTGVGLVLLAHAPAAVQEQVLAADLRLEPEGTGLPARDLRIQLAAVRREGVAVISRPWPEPMTSVACAITGPDRVPVAAVSVLTQAAAAEPAALAPAVIAVARAISRAVSATHPG
jgi:DNA-binding IclR family transcriptional regulator